MKSVDIKTMSESAGRIIMNLALISGGSMLMAVAVNGIMIPMDFASGGFVGLSMLIHIMLPKIPLSLIYLGVNLPLYILSYRMVGRRFLIYSLVGTALSSAALQWVHVPVAVTQPLPAALLAGIVMGLGLGLTLRSHGSTGGLDVLSVVLLKHFNIRLGSTVLAFNALILSGLAIAISLEGAIYTMVYLFVSTRIMDLMVTGFSRRRAVTVISPKWQEISQEIMSQLNRGVTMLPARGAYSGEEETMLYTVVAFQEMARLKRLIHGLDPNAFMVVSDTMEVMGNRIGNQPHW